MRGDAAPYFKSLNRPFLVMGVERSLFYLLIGLCLPIAFSGRFRPWMDLMTVLVFSFLYIGGVILARIDSQMLVIFKRHIQYGRYYAAQPGIHAKIRPIRASVPSYKTGSIS
jgi:type IV secretory pathway TrbD component